MGVKNAGCKKIMKLPKPCKNFAHKLNNFKKEKKLLKVETIKKNKFFPSK
jgi:hypothetical protein